MAGVFFLGLLGLHSVRELVGDAHGGARADTPAVGTAVGVAGRPSPLVTFIGGPAVGEAEATGVVRWAEGGLMFVPYAFGKISDPLHA